MFGPAYSISMIRPEFFLRPGVTGRKQSAIGNLIHRDLPAPASACATKYKRAALDGGVDLGLQCPLRDVSLSRSAIGIELVREEGVEPSATLKACDQLWSLVSAVHVGHPSFPQRRKLHHVLFNV